RRCSTSARRPVALRFAAAGAITLRLWLAFMLCSVSFVGPDPDGPRSQVGASDRANTDTFFRRTFRTTGLFVEEKEVADAAFGVLLSPHAVNQRSDIRREHDHPPAGVWGDGGGLPSPASTAAR